MEDQPTRILKIRLEGIAIDVESAAKEIKSALEVVEESRSYSKPDGRGVRRYLIALVKCEGKVGAP